MTDLSYNIADSGIRFEMDIAAEEVLRQVKYEFGFPGSKFGEIVYHRSYSRIMEDGGQEEWPDTVVRVMNGLFTIRKWWLLTHNLPWDEDQAQVKCFEMASRMLRMTWLPPGRGLFIQGTNYLYERGGMALYNCAFVEVKELWEDIPWLMDALMCGCGVGFGISSKEPKFSMPGPNVIEYRIPDTREGWVESVRLLLKSYTGTQVGDYPFVTFNYDDIRPYGEPIRGFGGVASGPAPLKVLHDQVRSFMLEAIAGKKNWVHLVADLANCCGHCVVVGNVRRSAEICLGSPSDDSFLNLKNYAMYPERQLWGSMSNNSARLRTKNDFLKIGDIAELIKDNGEPGIFNCLNVERYGRYGDENYGPDAALGLNPCGEIPLESYEVCNLSEVFPTRCRTRTEFLQALADATFYSSTVSLYPTHSTRTNSVVARNRRIGVSLSGIAEWIDTWGSPRITRWLKDGYAHVREVNATVNRAAGIAPSLRVTTVKPSGTISQLTGVPSGMHYPTFTHAIRRIRMDRNNPVLPILVKAGFFYEPIAEFHKIGEQGERKDYPKYDHHARKGMKAYTSLTEVVVECPIELGRSRPAKEVSAWEQFTLLAMLQREWADNSVSCTVYFDPETEAHQVVHMLSAYVPIVKSVSMLPHSDMGDYPQMPYEGISEEKYRSLITGLKPLEWDSLSGSDGDQEAELYCVGDTCVIPGEIE
jgi:ribonucleoside-diphosphate reductase alpha chain